MEKETPRDLKGSVDALTTTTEKIFAEDDLLHRLLQELNELRHIILQDTDADHEQLSERLLALHNEVDKPRVNIPATILTEILASLLELQGVLYERAKKHEQAKQKYAEAATQLLQSVNQFALELFLFSLAQRAKLQEKGSRDLFWYWKLASFVENTLEQGFYVYRDNINSFYNVQSIIHFPFPGSRNRIEWLGIRAIARDLTKRIASNVGYLDGQGKSKLDEEGVNRTLTHWMYDKWCTDVLETDMGRDATTRVAEWKRFSECFRGPFASKFIAYAIHSATRERSHAMFMESGLGGLFQSMHKALLVLYPYSTHAYKVNTTGRKEPTRESIDEIKGFLGNERYGFLKSVIRGHEWVKLDASGKALIELREHPRAEHIFNGVFERTVEARKKHNLDHYSPIVWDALRQILVACGQVNTAWSDQLTENILAEIFTLSTQHTGRTLVTPESYEIKKTAEVMFCSFSHDRAMALLTGTCGEYLANIIRYKDNEFSLCNLFYDLYKTHTISQAIAVYAWMRSRDVFSEKGLVYIFGFINRERASDYKQIEGEPHTVLTNILNLLTVKERETDIFKVFLIDILVSLMGWEGAFAALNVVPLQSIQGLYDRLRAMYFLFPFRENEKVKDVLTRAIDQLTQDPEFDKASPIYLISFLEMYRELHTRDEFVTYIESIPHALSKKHYLINSRVSQIIASFLHESGMHDESDRFSKALDINARISYWMELYRASREKNEEVRTKELGREARESYQYALQSGQFDIRWMQKEINDIPLNKQQIETLWDAALFICTENDDARLGANPTPDTNALKNGYRKLRVLFEAYIWSRIEPMWPFELNDLPARYFQRVYPDPKQEWQTTVEALPNVGRVFRNLLQAYYLLERSGKFELAKMLDRRLSKFRKYSSLNISPLIGENMHLFVKRNECTRLQFGVDVRRSGAIAVVGERGSGKSTLVNEFIARQGLVSDSLTIRMECLTYQHGDDFMKHLFTKILVQALARKSRLSKNDAALLEKHLKSVRYMVSSEDVQELGAEISASIFKVAPKLAHTAKITERDISYIELLNTLQDVLAKMRTYFSKLLIIIDEFDKMNNPTDETSKREKYDFLQGLRSLMSTDGIHFILVGLKDHFALDNANTTIEHSVFDDVITVTSDEVFLNEIMEKRIQWLGMNDVFSISVRKAIIQSAQGSPRKLVRIISDLVAFWAREHVYRLDDKNIKDFL